MFGLMNVSLGYPIDHKPCLPNIVPLDIHIIGELEFTVINLGLSSIMLTSDANKINYYKLFSV